MVGDKDGLIRVQLPVSLAEVSASADVRVLVLSKSARVRVQPSLRILSDAQQTNGSLRMRGLLLDSDAAIAMTPGLDVAANNVSA